jgi:hypothetical protein
MLSCFFWYWSDIFSIVSEDIHHFCVDVLRWGHLVIPSLVAKFTSIGPTCEPNQSKLTQFGHSPWLVGGLEPWNFMTFHSAGNVIIQLDKSLHTLYKNNVRNECHDHPMIAGPSHPKLAVWVLSW